MGMTGSSLQFTLLNSTTIENLSRKNVVWTLAIYMPKPPDVSSGFRTISFSNTQNAPDNQPNSVQSDAIRTFAILHTRPGENPFDLGPFGNFKSVMGDHWYDWLFPLRYSPCCDHDREDSQFAMGPLVQRMRKDAGISPLIHGDDEKSHRRHRRRRRRHRGDPGDARHHRSEKSHGSDRHQGVDTGHDRDDIDLESGLRRTNGSLH